ncbi:NAD(P)/FAD-dependent oxidoreductase [Ancylobacter oerskovii]|uniref:NAD(P)/FAD-dependent oxidoreductase n=1 Tax=Ancylobacter oerskovii TaxID=459519 RepID=A0ABW4YXE5_9HYPH|nr:FAD-dependent oxidoreductase [Ancylobacter oerskovii]MBS7542173.1 FAD-binding oxidoreductase [Ancylobacter oerskovii]
MAANDIFAEGFKDQPYWWEAAEPETDLDPLPARVDVAVIGSGYAGLNAATELARAGMSVVVLDGERIGEGGSTRSGGMVSSGQKLVVGGAIKGIDPELFERMIGDSIGSFDYLQTLINGEGLDADLKITGRFFGAHAANQMEAIHRNGRILAEKTGVTVSFFDRSNQRAAIGSDYYFGGMVIDQYGGLHPGKYHRALRQRARASGVMLRSHARAKPVQDGPNGLKLVSTARGDVLATHVVTATNGYTRKDAAPDIARRVVPVKSYQIATEPLPADLIETLIPGGRMISDTRRDVIYTRPSPDGSRILFGSRPGLTEVTDREAAPAIYARMTEIFPELRAYRISHAWSGFVAMTVDKVAHMGKRDLSDFAVGCNGNGVALMSYLGYQTAQKILGRQNRPTAFDREDFTAVPFYDGRPNPWFLPIAAAWYRLQDWYERR